jgi:TonB-dependent receptor
MSKSDQTSASLRSAISLALIGAGVTLPIHFAAAQESAAPAQETQELEEVVVTGFRGSLNTALSQKRESAGTIDSIVAEDIGKFPDSNLAESMQRIPSVALSRGDGGEGRNISVRGLGAGFTRVRINGMEGAAQAGASDIYGAGNGGRSFDFNVFPTEIFSQLAVRKTTSADVEEGSLGATVDLRAPRPFDYNDDTIFNVTGRGIMNSVSEDIDPRASALFSKTFADGTFGVLISGAFQERHLREVGYSAVDILSANASANNIGTAAAPVLLPYCTPIGWATTGPSPVPGTRGATAANCSAGAYGVPDGVRPASCRSAEHSGQRRVLSAPAALREFRAGHRAHRRHDQPAMGAWRQHHALVRWHAFTLPGGAPGQLHPRALAGP